MQALLRGLSPSERESLIRFYVDGHDAQRICRELRTPEAEFRVLRVRVKSRFHELCVQGATGTAV
jgi:DNA-directed RNA polymerase specialized sigma24 family protein